MILPFVILLVLVRLFLPPVLLPEAASKPAQLKAA
jgi:hypothetical protein